MKVTIRGHTFETPVYVDEATTRRYAALVAERFAEIEASAETVNTQVFALQTALHFVAESEALRSSQSAAEDESRARIAQNRREKNEELHDLSEMVGRNLQRMAQALEEVLGELGPEAPGAPPKPRAGKRQSGKGKPKLRVVTATEDDLPVA